jgi:hypothetical protein
MNRTNRNRALLWSALALAAGACGGGGGSGSGSPPMDMPVPMTPENAAPTIGSMADQTVDEDGISAPIELIIGDAESAPSELEVSATADDPTLLPALGIDLFGDGAARELTLIPAPGLTGSTNVTVTVTDRDGASTSAELRLTVNPLVRAEGSRWMRDTVLPRGEFDVPAGALHDDGSPLGELEDILRLHFADATAGDPAAYDDLLPQ